MEFLKLSTRVSATWHKNSLDHYAFAIMIYRMGVKESFLSRLIGNADKFSDEQVTQTISLLVEHGVKHQASDIHIEPHERIVRVRYRIDNVLKSVHKLPLAALPVLIRQIKAVAHMQENESLPQEGNYSTLVGEEQFEVQVNTIPVVGGEKAVLHISRRLTKPLSLEQLGFWGDNLRLLQTALTRTHGLIAVATPKRSGKTTTLHSLLDLVNTPTVSIATVEESIEYRVTDASQMRVRPQQGITFYSGLQAALNQDPNIILISSLADKRTCELAIHAAVSGHLIIAGMYGDDAPAALAHLQSVSEEPFLFAHALRIVLSQRLVRKLCASCRESYVPSEEEIYQLEKAFGSGSVAARAKVHELERDAQAAGIGGQAALGTTPRGIHSLWRASDEGCEHCGHSGYRGSIALIEVINGTSPAIQDALLARTSAKQLRRIILKDGFIPLEIDGLIKALRGQTTIPELLRVLAL